MMTIILRFISTFKRMSYEKQLKQEINRLKEQLKRVEQEKDAQEHQSKMALLEANTKLEFHIKKADEYQLKYRTALHYKDQEESVKELDQKLREKQDEIMRLMTVDHERVQEIQELLEEIEELKKTNAQLDGDLNQMKVAALNAIVDKDITISELTSQLEEFQNSENASSINTLKAAIAELQDKYTELEDKLEINRVQYIKEIEGKEEEINELHDIITSLKDKNDERVVRLTEEIANYEKHIEDITAERDHDLNYEEKYYFTEEKLRKAEKKLIEFEQALLEQRNESEHRLEKLSQENEALKGQDEELKETRQKISHLEKLTENIKNQWDEQKQKYEKQAQDHVRKIGHLENEKKIISDNLLIKAQEIDKLKAELEEKSISVQPKFKSSSNLVSPTKSLSEDTSVLIDKLKTQNNALNAKVQEQMKQLQESRQKLLKARGADGNEKVNELQLQIEQLTSYLKKVQLDMILYKLKYAEKQNKQSKEKEEQARKYQKQKTSLLERIEQMKKLIPKEKRIEYYKSGF